MRTDGSAAFTPLQRPHGERSWMNPSRPEQVTLKRAEARAPSESVCIGVHPWLKEFRAGHFHQGQAQRCDVAHPFAREQGHGAGAGAGLPRGGHHGVEEAAFAVVQSSRFKVQSSKFAKHLTPALSPKRRGRSLPCSARLCFPPASRGGVCGRVFLARLSEARDEAEKQRGVLAEEICAKHRTRPVGDADVAP